MKSKPGTHRLVFFAGKVASLRSNIRPCFRKQPQSMMKRGSGSNVCAGAMNIHTLPICSRARPYRKGPWHQTSPGSTGGFGMRGWAHGRTGGWGGETGGRHERAGGLGRGRAWAWAGRGGGRRGLPPGWMGRAGGCKSAPAIFPRRAVRNTTPPVSEANFFDRFRG